MATGLQAAQLGLVRILEAWRDEQLTAREYTTLLDLQARWIERELRRLGWPERGVLWPERVT